MHMVLLHTNDALHHSSSYTQNLQFREGIYGLYKKQKRQDWDHKAYHKAPSAI